MASVLSTEKLSGQQPNVPRWGAVFAMSLGAFVLVASEFMPVSLLTPLAADLGVSEGQAGQGIAFSGAFALVASLFISSMAGRPDRKVLLLLLTFLTVVSGSLVAVAPNYFIYMLGRALIGIAIGGFWSLSAATAIRLVPDEQVPRALAIVNGGNALAMVIAAPLGSFLGSIMGWRGAFFCIVPMAVIAFVWLLVSLPAMKPTDQSKANSVFRLLKRPPVAAGMLAVSLFFAGQFTLFTYLRPFLEMVTGVDASGLSLILLVMGLSGFAGTVLIGNFLTNGLYRLLTIIPLLMALIAVALVIMGSVVSVVTALLTLWGLIATAAPVAWWTWLAKTLPDDAEAGGGLMVAVVQLAIAFGATAGGLMFDLIGYRATFELSAFLLIAAALLAVLVARVVTRESRGEVCISG